MQSTLKVQGMCCSAEEQLIRNRLSRMPEVSELSFDLMNETLTVNHTFADEEPLRKALSDIGMRAQGCGESCSTGEEAETLRSNSQNLLLGIALALSIGSEVIAWLTGKEQSWPVIGTAVLAILLGGRETFAKGSIALRTFTLNINFLMSLAVIGAIVIGSWPEAAMVTVLFAIAERIESYSMDRARNAVRALMELAPETAWVERFGAWVEVAAGEVALGQRVRVKPGERIPLDGNVVSGESSVNQAPITGESLPVEKTIGDQLFAGTINEEGVLEFEVTGSRGNTTLDRIIKTVQEAQGSRAQTQRFIDSFARYYTPIVVLLALLVAVLPLAFGQPFWPWLYKALVLLVIACPCALVISTPVTVVSGLAAAAKRGILIKGGINLESGRSLRMIALDKTGTLTHGKPVVTDVVAMEDFDQATVAQLAASIDHLSAHPLAKAIEDRWDGSLVPVQGFKSVTGRGVIAAVDGKEYMVGNERMANERGVASIELERELRRLQSEAKTTVILAQGTTPIGVFGIADTLRQESVEAITQLHALGLKVAMLTGDNEATASAIGKQAGIDNVEAELLPEDKLATIERLLSTYGAVGMVGDGVNDAPALAKATVGFAMGGAGTDTALETADVAIMNDDLRRIPDFIRLSRQTATILTQNIVFALGLKVVFFALALTGHATLWMAVFADMGGSLLVVGNGLRLLRNRQAAPFSRHLLMQSRIKKEPSRCEGP